LGQRSLINTLNKKIMNKVFKIIAWTALCVVFVFAFGYVTMSLWNWLVPSLFNGPVVTFWQAMGILLLSKILFGFGGGHHRCGGSRSHYWKRHYYDKFRNMSPEDRERFKAKMKEKWCKTGDTASDTNTGTSNV
jgi:hypothetical protein